MTASPPHNLDWTEVDPSILGALFERTLDPTERAKTGAHYTNRDDIVTLLEPVVMAPLRREWDTVKKESSKRALQDFLERLATVRILDPACGSGNFLYVALQLLLDLEKEVIHHAARHGVRRTPQVNPTQLVGLEINPQARRLAQVVLQLGYVQWMRRNGFPVSVGSYARQSVEGRRKPRSGDRSYNPVPEPTGDIRLMDAILDLSDPKNPRESEWPEADFIVGNPPFLGNRLMPARFEPDYLSALDKVYQKRLDGKPDFCCYWFDKTRRRIAEGKCKRAGLLATQAIRGGTNRNVLKQIQQSGGIFFAQSDRDWTRDGGATVRVSMIGFDDGREKSRSLDGRAVHHIHSNLTTGPDITLAKKLATNGGIGFQGAIKRGPFDLPETAALRLLDDLDGKPNSDVVVPYVNGRDLTQRRRDTWVVDFGRETTQLDASQYTTPFEHVRRFVLPKRRQARQPKARDVWWLHWCTRPEMNAALAPLARFLATPRVAKHRVFTWLTPPSYPDCQLIVFARSDDYFLGVLQSRAHEIWARAQGTQVRDRASGFRYTPTTCFETFAFPKPTEAQDTAIAAAAAELDGLRSAWLNPREWTRREVLEFPGSVGGPWSRYIAGANAQGIGVVRYPRIVARDKDCARRLKDRTLTNLYNTRPGWLDAAHRRLDEAVFVAYGWPTDLTSDEILARLLELNLRRSGCA